MITLVGAPFEVREIIIISVTVFMENIREMVRIRQKIFSNKTMDLEGLPLYADTPVALTIIGSYDMPCLLIRQDVTCRAYSAIRKDVVEGMAVLVETLR